MPYLCTSISLRADEQKALADLVQKYKMNRHAIIKLILRRFLFPTEKKDIPLDDHAVTVQERAVKMPWDDPFAEPVEKPKTVSEIITDTVDAVAAGLVKTGLVRKANPVNDDDFP